MHELSIAINILEIVSAEAQAAGAHSVSRIELEIGSWSGIERDAIEMAMHEAKNGTLASEAEVIYHWRNPIASCEDCCNEFEPEDLFKVCPYCNSTNTHLLTGKELKVRSIDIITD